MKQAFGVNIPRTLEEVCEARRLALLIYDMQVGIMTQVAGAESTIASVRSVLDASRRAGLRTYFTRHMSLPLELMGAFQYRMAMAWQRADDPRDVKPWFLPDSPGFALVPRLAPAPRHPTFVT